MDLLTARSVRLALAALSLLACALPARAQDEADTRPAFSLASSQVFSTKDTPAISLMFRRVGFLDFRVYRVNDTVKFFTSLRDLHQLGSEEPIVPQERTWLEWLADWKAARRERVRGFVRAQFSWEYRHARQERAAQQQVQLRKTVRVNNFAQVPVLNASQLVSSWREILPLVRDTESRRVPLETSGPGVYVVEAVNDTLRAYTVVIISDVGLVTKGAPGQLLTFAANRFSGDPIPDCAIDVLGGRARLGSGRTGADGTATIALPEVNDDVVTLAQCGGQTTASDPGSWLLQGDTQDLVGYIYTDKPIYRPGHTVHLRAVLRWRKSGALAPFDRKDVEVVVSDQNDKVISRQTRPVDEYGSVLATVPVPMTAALGYYAIRINSEEANASGSFEVQEYRKPEFEVIVKPAERFVVQGGSARATISARYYFGQPVAGGTVKYVVHKQPYYSPLRWMDADEAEESGDGDYSFYGDEETSETTATLNDQGLLDVTIPLAPEEREHDYSARIEARVTDASSREVSGDTIVHATWAKVMLAGQTDRYVYAPGSAVTFTVRALDYVGAPQPNQPLKVWAEFVKPEDRYRGADTAGTEIAASTVQTDAEGRASWSMTLPKDPGTYLFKASTTSGDRTVTDTSWAWVTGIGEAGEGDEYLELVSDKRAYAPGDTARFAVRGGHLSGSILITKESQIISYHRVERASGDSFEVPIADEDVGDTYVNVAFLKDDRLYRAEKRVSVPAASRQLSISIAADQPVSKPQKPGTFTLVARDAAGAPVRAQISVGVIDEAVYAVKKDETPDPLRFFYRREYSRVGTSFSRDYSFVGYSGRDQLLLARRRRRPHGLADFKADKQVQPQVRKDFPDAIYWIGDLVTDAEGQARVEIRYPDALTTWRLTARAVTADTKVGGSIARTTTTKDLIVRVITPRFLTEGDEVAIPAIVHNYLPSDKSVEVSMKATGVTAAASNPPDTSTATIAQNGEQRIDWRFTSNQAGTAVFTGTAITDADSDAVELSLPVLPYGLKRQASQAGSIAGAGEQTVSLDVPATANPARRTIAVGLAPSLAGSLLGALDFLTSFPYGCTEQTLSGFLPNIMVTRALADLKLAPTERMKALDRQVSQGLQRLYDYQHEDGGWGWWKADRNHPFMTAYALYGLAEAKRAGYAIQQYRVDNGATALEGMYRTYPRAVPDLKVYMVYVLRVVRGEPKAEDAPGPEDYDPKKALEEVWTARKNMSAYGRALLLLTLNEAKDARASELAKDLLAEAQTAGDLTFWKMDGDPLLEDYSDTSVEVTAFAVKGLSAIDPKNPALERAVRWLLLNRNAGWYWSSTKQTAMVLYGLIDYMRARGELGATFPVDVLVNGRPAGSHTFTAAELTSPDPVVVTAPAQPGANSVQIVKRGGGALYWSATADYYETKAPLAPAGSRQLALTREYFTLSPITVNNRIVYREGTFSGNAAPGDVLLVRLTVAGASDWRYLVLEDPLPAGTEPIQKEDSYPLERPLSGGWWYGSEREFRDDRTVYFQESFGGRTEYSYLLKVITPGVFKAMPARVSPMYVPGVLASSEPRTFTIALPAGASR